MGKCSRASPIAAPASVCSLQCAPPTAHATDDSASAAAENDPRVATQLSMLACAPLIAVTTVIAVGGLHVTLGLALALGAALLLIDNLGWRIVAPMFDRERLITGTRS